MKIGRNDPCFCGSGKKYKKCCIDKQQPTYHKKTMPENEEEKINPFFQKYNSFDLLQSIAGLTITPENHGKYVRMELIAQEIIRGYNTNKEFSSPDTLKTFLDKFYPSNHLEDPPVNLFTDLITFYDGDYLIFPGITENGSFILSNLLTAIFHYPDTNISEKFKNNCIHAASFILCVSNAIAMKLGYTRYQDGEETESEIFFQNNEQLNKLKEAVTFSSDEMNQLLKENLIAKEALQLFLADINSPDFKTAYVEESPLLYKPILYTEEKYLVVSPATLSFALTHFIWAEAETWGCMEEVNDAYQSAVWNMIQLQLRNMKFELLHIEGTPNETKLPVKEGVYKFDDDKIAYIQMVYDSGSNFGKTKRPIKKDAADSVETLEGHKEETIAKIFSLPEYANFQLLHFTMVSFIGRDFYYPIKKTENARTIAMPVFEFDVLSNLKEADAIDLWKFAVARQEQLVEVPVMSFSFLDQFKIFKEHNDSFYLSDETKHNFLHVQPGYSAEMVRESKLLTDHHSVLISVEDRLATVPVERKDKYAPVYLNINHIASGELKLVVEGFPQPIWVSPKFIPENISGELRHMFWELNDAIAYWLWQIQDDCNSYLKLLGSNPLTVTFEVNPIAKFETIERNFIREENLSDKFETSATVTSFNIVIPSEIIPYLYGSDNEGERVLVKHLVIGFNKILASNMQPEIPTNRINEIVEKNAPLGMKKKFYILDTNDNLLLDPRNLAKRRYIQDYDIELVLNSIVSGLGNNCPAIGELQTKDEKEKLALNIVMKVLLPKLKKEISKYDSRKLLERLIGLNESLIRKREHLKILVPTRIACFVSVEQQEIDLRENLGKINRTTIATRCLIEHIAAEQPKGNQIISTTAIDEMLALIDQIISWGSLCDQIKYDLFDIKMGILPSGRVGTGKSIMSEVFDPYYASKTKEDVTDSIKSYEQVFPQRNPVKGKDTPEYLDKAFLSDYGISFNRICAFVEGLAIIGIQQETSFAVLPLNELKIKINKTVTPFNDLEFSNAINYLTLFYRGNIITVPAGFESYDISPWRFNRRLSFLRKPIVAFKNPDDNDNPFIYWGFRHVLAIRIYLVDQLFSGRLKVAEEGQVIKAIGKLVQERGDSLVRKVSQKLKIKDVIVDTEVPINSHTEFYDANDLGDIDVLAIDTINKILFSIECKSMSPSRNIKEMVEEVSKLFGSDTEKGWIKKHLNRDEWIKNNMPLIAKKYKVDLTGYTVKSLFVTEEDMLTPHLKKQNLPIPFVTRYNIEKDGINILLTK